MDLSQFRQVVSILADLVWLVPISIMLSNWIKLHKGQKLFAFYCILSSGVSIFSILLYFFKVNNHFLGFAYSIIELVFLPMVIYFFKTDYSKSYILRVSTVSFALLIVETYFLHAGMVENYIAKSLIRFLIAFLFGNYLVNLLIHNKKDSINTINMYISLGIMVLFFLKGVYSFFCNFLLSYEYNFYLYMQIENFVSMFTILVACTISWALIRYRDQKLN
ncbi:MAG: hypothetical protein ACRCVT_08635 [Leadbetterella sp.]